MKILVADPIAQNGIDLLRTHHEVDVKTGLSQGELVKIIGEYEGLVVRSETKVTSPVVEAAHQLQVIGRAGVGVDNIDLEAATRRGIVVLNAPTGNIIATAEHTVALLLALSRNVPQAHFSLRAGEWKRSEFVGTEVRNKTLGILGLGRVGSEVARRALGLQMHLLAHDPFIAPEYARSLGAELVGFAELLRRSDFVSVHVPLTLATKGFLGGRELALMKPSARLINCARGGIVDEEALLEAVESGQIAGAAVDVFSEEPATKNILLQSQKILVTPHLGASTEEAQVSVAEEVAQQIIAVFRGEPVPYAVNLPLIPPEGLSVLTPFLRVALALGELATQLVEGQITALKVTYSGDIAQYDVTSLTASTLKGLLGPIVEEPINLVNAAAVARSRGLKIVEEKGTASENYSNLITLAVTTTAGITTVAGTVMRNEPHIVLVDEYWVDVVPKGSYWLFTYHLDRPGMIGQVGTILGQADVNISSMQVGRLQPRGKALMALGVDEPIPPEQLRQLLAIPDIYAAKVVKL